MDIETERRLVNACRDGDKRAYAKLFKSYSKQVFAVCLDIVKSIHDAEDIAQEALITGYTQIRQLRDNERYRSWIIKIARNRCLQFKRRRKRYKEVLKIQDCNHHVYPREHIDLYKAITKLPEKLQSPLVLYYLDGQSTSRVAEILNMTPAGVLTRISRARKELRKLLALEEESDG